MIVRPSSTLVVDANIVLSAVLGRRTRQVILGVVARRRLVMPDHALDEVRTVLTRLPQRPDVGLGDMLASVDVVPRSAYEVGLPATSLILRNAVVSRNGSVADAHILARAWLLEADIWSHDRDFAGTGLPSWSSANLVAALDDLVTPIPDH